MSDHLKTFIRPSQFLTPNAHRSLIKNPNKAYHANGTQLNKINPPYKNNQHYINPINFTEAQVFIAHYYVQSEETYIKRKIILPRDDWGSFREKNITLKGVPITENYNIHSEYNEVINTLVQRKYSEKIKRFLKDIEENNLNIPTDDWEKIIDTNVTIKEVPTTKKYNPLKSSEKINLITNNIKVKQNLFKKLIYY